MTETVISSATRTVVIGFDRPFCIIGERINPTGRKKLAAEMAAGDFSTVEQDTLAQVAAGAHMLDVNAGIPLADEPAILAKTIQLVQSLTDLPLSIDSSIVAALEAGLAVYKGRPLVNSVTGEEERLEAVLPLIKKYDCAGGRDLQRRDRHQRGPRRPLRGGQEDRPPCPGLRHQAQGHRGRPAGHADRRARQRRQVGVPPPAPPQGGAEGQQHLRRLQRQLRPAQPARPQRRLPVDGGAAPA